jgi:chaperonin GroES
MRQMMATQLKPLELLNTSGMIPVDLKALVKVDPPEEKLKSGLIIPESALEKQKYAAQKATIVAVGKSCFAEWIEKPAEGERVLIAQYSGALLKGADGQDYRIINDEDIIAVLQE